VDSVEIKYPSKARESRYARVFPSGRHATSVVETIVERRGDGRNVPLCTVPRLHDHRPHQHAHCHDEPLVRSHSGLHCVHIRLCGLLSLSLSLCVVLLLLLGRITALRRCGLLSQTE